MTRCEWPPCRNRARVHVTAPNGHWGRWVCGLHERRARRLRWTTDPVKTPT